MNTPGQLAEGTQKLAYWVADSTSTTLQHTDQTDQDSLLEILAHPEPQQETAIGRISI